MARRRPLKVSLTVVPGSAAEHITRLRFHLPPWPELTNWPCTIYNQSSNAVDSAKGEHLGRICIEGRSSHYTPCAERNLMEIV